MSECILNAGRQRYFSSVSEDSGIVYPEEFIIVQETTCNVEFDSNLYGNEYDIYMYLDGGKSTSTATTVPASKYNKLLLASQDMENGYGTDIDIYIGNTLVGNLYHANTGIDYMSETFDISNIKSDGVLKLVNNASGGYNSIEEIKLLELR